MSTPEKPDHARGWLYVEKLLDDEEDERGADSDQAGTAPASDANDWSADELLGMAEVRAAKQSVPAAPVPAVGSPPAPPQPAAPEPKLGRVLPIRRPWRRVGLAAAACFAAFLLVKLTLGPDRVSHPRDDRTIAEADRDMAEASCALKDWAACKDRLDEAAKLDPAGEREPRVQKARAELAAGVATRPAEAGAPR